MGGGVTGYGSDEQPRIGVGFDGLQPGWAQDHVELRAAFSDWLTGKYPEARVLGDVVDARKAAAELGELAISDAAEGLNNA